MSHDHGHVHGVSSAHAGARHRRALLLAFALTASFLVVQAAAGFLTNSLALLSDAGHMLTDVIGLGMALAAIQLAARHAAEERPGDRPGQHTFGLYRLEILAAFVNALLLFGVAVYVLIEAARRVDDDPEVLAVPMLIVAVVGLGVNVVAFLLLRRGAEESINLRGAYLEVLADLLGSVGVIVAAVVLQVFGWAWADPVIAAAIGVWILPRTFHLGRQAVRILLQAAPPSIDVDQLSADLGAVDGVIDVHDLHLWTLTSGMDSLSAHLVTADGTDHHAVLDRARDLLADRYHIDHSTLQVEPESHDGCDRVQW